MELDAWDRERVPPRRRLRFGGRKTATSGPAYPVRGKVRLPFHQPERTMIGQSISHPDILFVVSSIALWTWAMFF